MTPYYSRNGISLYHGDCLSVMRSIPPGSADAIVTDPPYGQSSEAYDQGVDPAVWRECRRIATQSAALVSFAGSPTYHRIASGIESAGWRVRQMWAWIYRDGMITSAWPREGFDRLAPAFDPICFATAGKMLLDLSRVGDDEWRRPNTNRGRCKYSDRSSSHGVESARGRWPRSVVASDELEGFQYFVLSRVGATSKEERTSHPNQKPISLMEWIVGKLPANTVLDPFAGSGTTLVAAARLGRRAVGIDMNEDYCAIAARRLDAELDAIAAAA